MDDEITVSRLLSSWGYCQQTINKFEEEGIEISHLSMITEYSLEKLFPKIGERLTFMTHLEKFRSLRGSGTQVEMTPAKRKYSGNDEDSESTTKSVCSTSTIRSLSSDKMTLQEILTITTDGKMIMSQYKTHNKLDDLLRQKLADEIIRHELRYDVEKNFPNTDIEYWTDQIKSIFEGESYEVWAGYTKGRLRDSAAGRGMLLTRYYNMRRKLHKSGVLRKKSETEVKKQEHNIDNNIPDEDQEDILLWLKNNSESVEQVKENWDISTSARRYNFMKHNTQIHEYMNEFAALKCSDGYRLLEIDFKNLYPKANMQLYIEWPTLAAFITSRIKHPKENDDINDCFSTDGKKVKILRSLSSLFGVKNVVMKKTKQWRPSKMESRDGLIQYVKVSSEIQPEVNRKKKKFLEFGLNCGPLLFAVSEDEDLINSCSVVINDVLYNFDNPLKAFDVYFKIFHALHCVYPKESEREMLFIQRAVYGIDCHTDNKVSDNKTMSLIDDYKKFKPSLPRSISYRDE